MLLLDLVPALALCDPEEDKLSAKTPPLPDADDIEVELIAELEPDAKLPVDLAPDQDVYDPRRGNPSMADLLKDQTAADADVTAAAATASDQKTRQGESPSELPVLGELDESECSASQPVVMGNITWTGERKQTMEGMGGSMVFYTNWLTFHPNKNAIYKAIYSELQPSILRLRNSWDSPNVWQSVNDILAVDQELVAEANKRLPNRKPKVLLTSWSPPAFLKSNGVLGGLGNSALIKDNMTDQFVYDRLAAFWVDGLAAYKAVGIEPKYIAMNEPDWQAPFDSSSGKGR